MTTDRRRGRRTFECPRRAAVHNHKVVKAFVQWADRTFDHRAQLTSPIRNEHGNIIWRPRPEFLLRPHEGESAEALDRRRADWIERLLSVIVTLAACMDFRTLVVRNPGFEKPGADPMLSLRQLAIEAGLPEDKYTDPVNGIERAVRFLNDIGLISKTVQWRAKQPDGTIRSYGAAQRRLSFHYLCDLDPEVERAIRQTRAALVQKAEDERRAQEEKDAAFTAARAELHAPAPDPNADIERIPRLPENVVVAPPPPPPDPDGPLFDLVEREHPEWVASNDFGKIHAEVRRRRRQLAPDTS